jgi:hypothetical protein
LKSRNTFTRADGKLFNCGTVSSEKLGCAGGKDPSLIGPENTGGGSP